MAKSASAVPPTSVSMWPASARSARLPVQRAPSTSTTKNAAVSPSAVTSLSRERAAAVGRSRWAITRIVAGSCYNSVSTTIDRSRRTASAFAGGQPERVERVIVVDIGPDIAPGGRLRVGAMMAQTPERFDDLETAIAWARGANPRYTDTMLRHRVVHGTRPVDGGLVWKYDRAIRDAVRSGRWRDPADLWPLWSAITCPTLVVRGAESDVLAPETVKRMLATNPHARLVEVDGAGHTVPGDQPAAFRRILAEFLVA